MEYCSCPVVIPVTTSRMLCPTLSEVPIFSSPPNGSVASVKRYFWMGIAFEARRAEILVTGHVFSGETGGELVRNNYLSIFFALPQRAWIGKKSPGNEAIVRATGVLDRYGMPVSPDRQPKAFR
jgi:hypothetical protein